MSTRIIEFFTCNLCGVEKQGPQSWHRYGVTDITSEKTRSDKVLGGKNVGEYKTLDEWFPNGRGDGRKFITQADDRFEHWFEPVFRAERISTDSHIWHGVSYSGKFASYSMVAEFKEWHPPKKKVTKYLFVHKESGGITLYMEKDMSEFIEPEKYIRLDWSATEFDDE